MNLTCNNFLCNNSGSMLQIAEFFAISMIVIFAYLAMGSLSKTVKPATKMLAAILMGTTLYVLAKFALIAFIIEPTA